MTREEEIIELTKRTCNAYRRQEPLARTCGGFQECDCKCLQYNRCEAVYDAGWHKQIEAEWIPNDVYYSPMDCYVVQGYTCSNCKTKVDEYTNYCSYCGAKMTIKGE